MSQTQYNDQTVLH